MIEFKYVIPEDITESEFNELVSRCRTLFEDTKDTGHYGYCDPTYDLFIDDDNGYFWIDLNDIIYNWGVDNNPQRACRGSYLEMVELLDYKQNKKQ